MLRALDGSSTGDDNESSLFDATETAFHESNENRHEDCKHTAHRLLLSHV